MLRSVVILTNPCSIGLALADTLDDLISSRRIEPQLAMRILQNFDQSISTVLGEKVKARMTFKVWSLWRTTRLRAALTATLQGHLDTYRFCDEVWTFIIKDVKFKLDNTNTVEAERVKIVACQSKEKAQWRENDGETWVDNLALHACKVLKCSGWQGSRQAGRTMCYASLQSGDSLFSKRPVRQVIECWPPQLIGTTNVVLESTSWITAQRSKDGPHGFGERKEGRNLMIPMQICNSRWDKTVIFIVLDHVFV
jgi:transcription initiation factor TFIIA small subunit